MTTDFRALCAELVKLLQNCPVTADTDWMAERMTLLYRVRTALKATSPPEPPTDQELLRLYGVATPCYHVEEFKRELNFVRAALERWG